MVMPSKSNTFVWVHTWWKRDADIHGTLTSIRASDIGEDFHVFRQPEDEQDAGKFHLDSWRRACDSGAEWVLRLEDDVVVSKSILARLSQWEACSFDMFGAGWLACDKSVLRDATRVSFCGEHPVRTTRLLHCGFGILMRADMARKACKVAETNDVKSHEFDLVVSAAVWDLDKFVVIARPGLCAPIEGIESTMGHAQVKAEDYEFAED